jgi:hypothetical protein
MTTPLPSPLDTPPSTMIAADWMRARLTEARGILADTAQHPSSLVILAARVVAGHTDDASECSDALGVLQRLDRRPLHVIAAAAFPNGGAP